MGVTGFAHAAFNVTDMERSISFYAEVFGARKAFEIANPATGKPWIVYIHIAGDQFIELFYGGEKIIPYEDSNAGFSHVCLAVTDINGIADRIVQCGAPLDSPVRQGRDGNWQCWTHDPDGNRIELMQMSEDSLQNQFVRSLTESKE